jgi:hypothetical protein
MTRGRLRAVLGCLLVGMCALSVLATTAGAATPDSVRITAEEFFPAIGTPTIVIHAQGGIFGETAIDGSGATEQVLPGSDTSGLHRRAAQYHGVDIYTTDDGSITFKWQFTCKYTSPTASTCEGSWRITDADGDYTGAQGGGSALDLCVDQLDTAGVYIGTGCNDVLTGKIQAA